MGDFAHFHSLISYGIIFWGSSALLHNAFLIQKRVIWILLGLGHMTHAEMLLKTRYTHCTKFVHLYVDNFCYKNLHSLSD